MSVATGHLPREPVLFSFRPRLQKVKGLVHFLSHPDLGPKALGPGHGRASFRAPVFPPGQRKGDPVFLPSSQARSLRRQQEGKTDKPMRPLGTQKGPRLHLSPLLHGPAPHSITTSVSVRKLAVESESPGVWTRGRHVQR